MLRKSVIGRVHPIFIGHNEAMIAPGVGLFPKAPKECQWRQVRHIFFDLGKSKSWGNLSLAVVTQFFIRHIEMMTLMGAGLS